MNVGALGRRSGLHLVFLLAVLLVAALIVAHRASAYNGEFCYHIYLKVHTHCDSNTETNVRRAIGHGADYSAIGLYGTSGGPALADDYCYSDGCTVDTGYLSRDHTAWAELSNIGDPCGCGGGYYYGWMYP